MSIYQTLGVPPPTLSAAERQRRRLAFRNERRLYHRRCSETREVIVSIYSDEKPFPVFSNDYWWSDDWEPRRYGREFNYSKTFFEQFHELQNTAPHCALAVIKPTMENSDYCNQAGWLKNCYLLFDSRSSEQCMYGKTVERCFDCVDCLKAFDCERCYEAVNCWNCYECIYVSNSQSTSESYYSDSLVGCSSCFGCVNLRNASFCFYNEALSKEEWLARVASMRQQYSPIELQEKFAEFRETQFFKWMQEKNTEDCTGDYLIDCKNCEWCFDSENLEDCKYCYDLKRFSAGNYKCYDVSHFGGGLEYCCECVSIGNNLHNSFSCENVWTGDRVYYSRICTNCENIFGCISLRNAKYCILNKQYSKEEYEALRRNIVEHMKETGE